MTAFLLNQMRFTHIIYREHHLRKEISIKDINLVLEKIKELISKGEYTFIDRGKTCDLYPSIL